MKPEPVAAVRAALVDGAEKLGLTLDNAQVDQLIAYLGLLQRWNAVYNLTAVRDLRAMLTQHVLDCLAVVLPLQRQVGSPGANLLDVGSGGGLPAAVIAVALPEVQVTSVDAVGKKAAFVRQVAAELKLKNLRGEHARVEALARQEYDVIASRAFAALAEFVRLTWPSATPATRWLAMKGKVPLDEIAALPPNVEVFHVEPLDVPGLAAERCIVWMRQKPPPPFL